MRPKNTIQKFEYEPLRIGEEGFSEKHFVSLCRLAEKSDQMLFKIGNKKVIFQNYVGVLQVGSLTIEVLPKADRAPNASHAKWRNALFEMLRLTGKVTTKSSSSAFLNLRRGNLFDLYLDTFLIGCEELVQTGLQRKYLRKEGELNFFKGRVNFRKQNAGNQAKIISEYTDYDINHPLHRVLFHGIDLIPLCTTNPEIINKSKVLRNRLPEIPRPSMKDIEAWRKLLNRSTSQYKESLAFAELIIKSLSPIPNIGHFETISLLFDMNSLFEEYIVKCFKISSLELGLEVKGQVRKKFWETKTVRPDIVLGKGDDCFVIDTKWKVLSSPTPSDSDLKQIYVYNNYFDCFKSLLLYPNVYDLQNRIGKYHKHLSIGTGKISHSCMIGFIDLFENEYLKRPNEIAKEIWESFELNFSNTA